MDRPYRDRDWLEYQYHERGLTQREIGEICDVSPTTIRKQMKAFGIETREIKGENHGLYGKERPEEVKQKISETLTGREFSDQSLRRMSEAHQGQSIPEDVREKISESLQGIPKSKETRQRMSTAKLGEDVDWDKTRYMKSARGRGFKAAKRRVHKRDRVCQSCDHDGSERTLVVHHIIPVRFFRDSPLGFQDAHSLGNLILLCKTCHPEVEWGQTDIEPDFDAIPSDHRDEFWRLWIEYIEWKASIGNARRSVE